MKNPLGRGSKKPFYKRKRYIALFILVFTFLTGIGYYAYSLFNFTDQISKPSQTSKKLDEWTGTGRVNIALIGVDSRPGEGPPRADTMMVLSIDPQTKDAALFSIMRDTYYKIPGYGFRKINEAHALGGPELVMETLSNFMQLPIHYYVKTDFEGFSHIVDALGGIDMYVEKDMYWPDDGVHDINLKKGYQHLDGKKALMYVRFRHDAMSDYARTERQRKFLSTLAKELKTTNSIVKLPQILNSVEDDIETDMTLNDMMKLGKLAYSLDIDKMETLQLPPVHDSTGTKFALLDDIRDGASVIIPDLYETRLLVHKTLGTGKTVVKTLDDQAPFVQNPAQPKPTPTPNVSNKQATPKPSDGKTPPVPNSDGKIPQKPGSGTDAKTTTGGTSSGSANNAGTTNGDTTTGGTSTSGTTSGTTTNGTSGGTTTGGTGTSGTNGSTTGNGSGSTPTGGSQEYTPKPPAAPTQPTT